MVLRVDFDEILALYTALIGVSSIGDRDVDRRLALWLARNASWRSDEAFAGDASTPYFTLSFDAAQEFLTTALPGFQIHTIHGGETAWMCEVCRTGNAADAAGGIGKSGPLAILSAAVTMLITLQLLHWRLEPREQGELVDG